MVTIYTTGFITQQSYVLPIRCIYMFCVYLRTKSNYFQISINWLAFITETASFYCAVRTGYLVDQIMFRL